MQVQDHERMKNFSLLPWAIYIDIEGFSNLYLSGQEEQALSALRSFTHSVKKVFDMYRGDESKRLFIHGFSDGFVIRPDFGDKDLDRPIAISIALMKSALLINVTLKAAISWGTMADIQGIYDRQIMEHREDQRGVITIGHVMGDGLIRTHGIARNASGPLLLIDKELEDYIPRSSRSVEEYSSWLEIDWLEKISDDLSESILHGLIASSQSTPSRTELVSILKKYLEDNAKLSDKWRKNCNHLISGLVAQSD